jgi:hypothetical protein
VYFLHANSTLFSISVVFITQFYIFRTIQFVYIINPNFSKRYFSNVRSTSQTNISFLFSLFVRCSIRPSKQILFKYVLTIITTNTSLFFTYLMCAKYFFSSYLSVFKFIRTVCHIHSLLLSSHAIKRY